jgi:ketosteroid isomerase-like protein
MEASTIGSRNLALARQLFDLFAHGDVDAMSNMLHPSVHAAPSIGGGPSLDGPDAVLAWWKSVAASGAEIEARPLDYEVVGDCVIVRGYIRHRENRVLAERMTFWLYEISEGQIVRMESYPTRAAALAGV